MPTFCGHGLPGRYPTYSRWSFTRTYALGSSFPFQSVNLPLRNLPHVTSSLHEQWESSQRDLGTLDKGIWRHHRNMQIPMSVVLVHWRRADTPLLLGHYRILCAARLEYFLSPHLWLLKLLYSGGWTLWGSFTKAEAMYLSWFPLPSQEASDPMWTKKLLL